MAPSKSYADRWRASSSSERGTEVKTEHSTSRGVIPAAVSSVSSAAKSWTKGGSPEAESFDREESE